jgi:hypothetical protein
MIPAQPGWIAIPKHGARPGEHYMIVGWDGYEPVIAVDGGIYPWHVAFGEDKFLIGMFTDTKDLAEWIEQEQECNT